MDYYTLDGSRLTDKKDLHAYISGLLQLPDCYGNNLDALYDCLCEIGADTTVDFINVGIAKSALGDYFNAFATVLNDAAVYNPHLSIIYKDS